MYDTAHTRKEALSLLRLHSRILNLNADFIGCLTLCVYRAQAVNVSLSPLAAVAFK
jgi:hypothetical protein